MKAIVMKLPQQVIELGSEVTSDDINAYIGLIGAQDKSYQQRTIVDAWANQQDEDRNMRKSYAKIFIWIIALQLIGINVAFFLIGFSLIAIDPTISKFFFVSVFAEVASMTLVILKYLFPTTGTGLLNLFEKKK